MAPSIFSILLDSIQVTKATKMPTWNAPSQDILAEKFADFKAVWPERVSENEGFHPEIFGAENL